MSRYDRRTTTFSPEGRLHQVEYAMQAISQAGACIGVLCSDGVVFGCEKKAVSKLLVPSRNSEKMYKCDDHVAVAVAGLASDANVLVQYIRSFAQQHRFTYQEAIPVEQLVIRLCDVTHWQTFAGGQRPFGVSFLFGGWDTNYGFQLYHAMPNGNYIGWSAIAIGNNHQMAQDVLKKQYKPEETPDVQGGLKLCAKVLGQALDSTKGSADVMEFSVLMRDATTGATSHTVLSPEECEALLKTVASESASKSDE
jgi:20S proteasome subunit alpha 3